MKNELLKVRFSYLGWLSGIEPESQEPQSYVLTIVL